MPHLRDLLADLPRFGDLPVPTEPRRLEAASRQVALILGDTTARKPSPYDLMQTYDLLAGMPATQHAFRGLPSRHLKRAPWVLFESPREGRGSLADNREFLLAYLAELKRRLFAPAIVLLATVFLRHYPSSKPYFGLLREHIWGLMSHLTTASGRRLYERAERFGFFREDGAAYFGRMLADATDPAALVVDAGVDSESSQKGFVRAAVESMLEKLSDYLGGSRIAVNHLAQTLAFLAADAAATTELRFPSLRAETADALLRPFASQPPDPAIQEIIKRFLLERFNDPRIHPGNWHAVPEESRVVIMRWLVHGTLEDFFRVVREGSQHDRDADRMWPYREAFWTAYLKKGVITDAWVVLGELIAHTARQFLKDQVDNYGVLQHGYGVKPAHAVLIMRIGNLVITEWNHMGKYRVWHADNPNAPRFYKAGQPYTRAELIRKPDFDGAHQGAENGTWQDKLSSYIAHWASVHVMHLEYMPK